MFQKPILRSDVVDVDAAVDEMRRQKVAFDAVVERTPNVVSVVIATFFDDDSLDVGDRFFSIVLQRVLKDWQPFFTNYSIHFTYNAKIYVSSRCMLWPFRHSQTRG